MYWKQRFIPLVLLLTLLAVFGTALPAFAHHNEFSASVNCAKDWTAVANYVGGEDKKLVLLSSLVINGVAYAPSMSNAPSGSGGTPPRTAGVIARAAYGGSTTGLPAATAQDFLWVGVSSSWTIFSRSGTGTFTNTAGQWAGTIKMFSWDGSKWNQDDSDSVTAPALPTNCTRPANPGATIEHSCKLNPLVIALTLSNSGGVAINFTYTVNGVPTTVAVSAESSKTVNLSVTEDQTYVIKVVAGDFSVEKTITVDCQEPPKPGATAEQQCAENPKVIALTLSNTGGGTAVMTYRVDGGADVTVNVAAGQPQTVNLPAVEDTTYIVVVEGPGGFVKEFTILVNCDEPTGLPVAPDPGLSNNEIFLPLVNR